MRGALAGIRVVEAAVVKAPAWISSGSEEVEDGGTGGPDAVGVAMLP